MSTSNIISALLPQSLGNVNSLANRLGIDPVQLSGLSPTLKSKLLGQLGTFVNKLPENFDLSALNAQGVDLNTIPLNKLANLPISAPYSTAPVPAVDTQFLNSVISKEGVAGLTRVYGVTDISKLPASELSASQIQSLVSQALPGITNPFNKFASSIQSISPLVGASLSATNKASAALNGLSDISNQFGSKTQTSNIISPG